MTAETFPLAQVQVGGSCEHSNETSSSIRAGIFWFNANPKHKNLLPRYAHSVTGDGGKGGTRELSSGDTEILHASTNCIFKVFTKYYFLTGDVKYAPLITEAKNTTKYSNFCVVTWQAWRNEGAFIRCHSDTMHITSWIKHTNANKKKTVANAT